MKTCKTNKRLIPIIGVLMIWSSMMITGAFAAEVAGAPDTRTIVTVGNSHIYNDNITAARTAAIADARQDAIETAAASLLSKENLTEGFEAFSGVVHGREGEFIGSYRILKEFKTGNDYYVLVLTSVMMDRVKHDLAAAGLSAAGGALPPVLFMIAEKATDDIDYSYWWTKGRLPFPGWPASAPIIQTFRDNGFTVVEPDMTAEENSAADEGLKLKALPADFDAITFARRLGAELVVVGTANAQVMPNELGEHLHAYKGTINLRALRCDTGAQIANINDTAVITSEDPAAGNKNALSNAGISAGRELVQRLLATWKATPAAAGHITVTVSGTDVLSHFEAIKDVLAGISGINTLMMSEMTPDKAVLSVDYSGSASELADTLLMKSFPGFGIHIVDVDETGMTLKVK